MVSTSFFPNNTVFTHTNISLYYFLFFFIAAAAACLVVRGSVCSKADIAIKSKRGAAVEMAETAAACKEAGEASCDALIQASYEGMTGKTYSKKDAIKLLKQGAKSTMAEMMAACEAVGLEESICFATAKSTGSDGADTVTGAEVSICKTDSAVQTAQKKCSDPEEKPEMKQALAAALGKDAADVTKQDFKKAVIDGAKGEVSLGLDSCIEIAANKAARAACLDPTSVEGQAIYDEVKSTSGKPEMTNDQVKRFIKKSAIKGATEKMDARVESAAESTCIAKAPTSISACGTVTALNDATACDAVKTTANAVACTYTTLRMQGKADLMKALGKEDATEDEKEREFKKVIVDVAGDEMENCMTAKAIKNAAARTECRTSTKDKLTTLTGETVSEAKMQKDVVRAAKRKVGGEVEACREANVADAAELAKCGDPKNNAALKQKLKDMTGLKEISNLKAAKMIKEGGQSEVLGCMEDCTDVDRQVCKATALACLKGAVGEKKSGSDVLWPKKEDLQLALKKGVATEVTDVILASDANSVLAAKKTTARKAKKTGYYTDDTVGNKKLARDTEKLVEKGKRQHLAAVLSSCNDLAGTDATKRTACQVTAKAAKADIDGVPVEDVNESDLVMDLKKAAVSDLSSGIDACMDNAAFSADKVVCRTEAKDAAANALGQTTGRRLVEMEKGKLEAMLTDGAVESLAGRTVAAFEEAKETRDALELTGSNTDKLAADNAHLAYYTPDKRKERAARALMKDIVDLKDGETERREEDAAVELVIETMKACKKGKDADSSLPDYTIDEKKDYINKEIKKIRPNTEGAAGSETMLVAATDPLKTFVVKITKKAGAKEFVDKVKACREAASDLSTAKTIAGCTDNDLREAAKDAKGVKSTCIEKATTSIPDDATLCSAVTALDDATACDTVQTTADANVAACIFDDGSDDSSARRAIRKAFVDRLESVVKANDDQPGRRLAGALDTKPTSDQETKDVSELLGRADMVKNDEDDAIAEYIGDMKKYSTAGTDVEKRTQAKAAYAKIRPITKPTRDVEEEIDEVFEKSCLDDLDDAAACDDVDKAACDAEVNTVLMEKLGKKAEAIGAKKNQLAILTAARAGADHTKSNAGTATEAATEAKEMAKYKKCGGVEKNDVIKAKIKKIREMYLADKEIIIKKKNSIDVIVSYIVTGNGCDATKNAEATTKMKATGAADFDSVELADKESVIKGSVVVEGSVKKCKLKFIAKKVGTDTELEALADKFTVVAKIGTTLSGGRRLTETDAEVSATQTTEIETSTATTGQPTTVQPTTTAPTTAAPTTADAPAPYSDSIMSDANVLSVAEATKTVAAFVLALLM